MFKRLLRYPFYFGSVNYLPNHIINKIPSYTIQHIFIIEESWNDKGKGSSVHMNTFFNRSNIEIGTNSVINRSCYIDGKRTVRIGNSVSISPEVHIITGSHHIDSETFEYYSKESTLKTLYGLAQGH